MNGIDVREFVAKGIKKVFEDLAVALADELAEKYGADMPAGAMVFQVTKAEMYLLTRWAQYADRETKREQVGEK
jgi:hypothetical protein